MNPLEKAAKLIEERAELLRQRAEQEAPERFAKQIALNKAQERKRAVNERRVAYRAQVALNRVYYELARDMISLWSSMHTRCKYDPLYKGRISVCPRWGYFNNFWADMREHPGWGYSLGRIDNDKDYSPENCRWELPHQQAANKRWVRNTSGAVGVTWESSAGKWRAEGRFKGKRYRLYTGDSFEKAVAARRLWEETVQRPGIR